MNTKDFRGINMNLSYYLIREIIGWTGLAFPWLLIIAALIHDSSAEYFYQPSISDYYYTVSGVLFIGFLTLIGVFLISYRGYKPESGELSDNIITWVGGILILVVALVPTPYMGALNDCPTPICHESNAWGLVHFGAAVGFFIAMSYMSLKKFTKGDTPFSSDKLKRNKIYRFCGWGMVAVLALSGILIVAFKANEKWDHMIFWVEVIMLTLFGISWLVKGKGLKRLGMTI